MKVVALPDKAPCWPGQNYVSQLLRKRNLLSNVGADRTMVIYRIVGKIRENFIWRSRQKWLILNIGEILIWRLCTGKAMMESIIFGNLCIGVWRNPS